MDLLRHGARRAAHLADHRHQRADDQGHARTDRGAPRACSSAIDKARPEVIIDVELLEVDRTRLQEYGLQFASPGSPGIDGSSAIATDRDQTLTITLQALRNLTQADVLLANLPALYYRLLKTDTNTRTLANPQLRTIGGHRRAGAVRRAGAGSGHDLRADCHRRHAAAADHVVQLPRTSA